MAKFYVSYIIIHFLINIGIRESAEATAEVFADLDQLSSPHPEVITNAIGRYAEAEMRRLDELQRIVTKLRRYEASQRDPLVAFLLIKRLLRVQQIAEEKVKIEDYRPVQPDAVSNALAIFRLQDTYNLNVKDMANGNLSADHYEEQKNLRMTAADCFDLGKSAFELDPPDYYHALAWLQEAHDRLSTEDPPTMKEEDLLVYLSISLSEQGNLERATAAVMRLKRLAPDFPKVDENLDRYLDEMKEQGISTADLERNLPPLRLDRVLDERFPDLDVYERLCRGELRSLESQKPKTKQLTCYLKRSSPFLRLAPLKVERLHFDPEIVVVRDGVSRKEADVVNRLARSKLRRSVISTTTSIDVAKYRTSKTAWLEDRDDPVIAAISRRVEDISGLTTRTAENFQVANYELGGHYMPHFDFAGDDRKHQFANLGTGDRIATVLFYLSDTKAGGATVFPTLRLTVYPQENDALVWFNLDRNGNGDRRTRHAACPVLLGVKWITNKWLHEYGQEFRRPCGLVES